MNSAIGDFSALQRGDEREGLEGFAEAHFVGEDAAEVVVVEIPEPSDTEALIRAEEGVELGGEGGGREGGEVAEGGGTLAPGGRGLEVGGEFVEDVLGFGDAGGGDAVGAAGGEAGGAAGFGEAALGGGEALQFRAVDEVDGLAVFEVGAAGGGGVL